MKRVIVHIGFPRTATSWFQQKYFPKVENYSFLSRKIFQEQLIHPSSLNFNSDDLKIRYSGEEHIIISDEMISGRVRAGQVNHLFFKEYVNRILAVFPYAEFIVFLRNQADLILSMYKLYVEKGGTYSLKKFLNSKTQLQRLMLYSYDAFNFYDYLVYLESIVGREKLNIFLYEDFRKDPKDFLKRFEKHFSFSITDNNIDKTYVNTSISNRKLQILRLKNSFSRHGIPFKHYYFHLPFLYPTKRSSIARQKKQLKNIPQELISECKKFETSNKLLTDHFELADLHKYNYPLPL